MNDHLLNASIGAGATAQCDALILASKTSTTTLDPIQNVNQIGLSTFTRQFLEPHATAQQCIPACAPGNTLSRKELLVFVLSIAVIISVSRKERETTLTETSLRRIFSVPILNITAHQYFDSLP